MKFRENLIELFIEKLSKNELGLKRKTVSLVKHNPLWWQSFDWVQKKIKEILPKEEGFNIEHVGSTSIPKLSAKPILDILIVFESSEEQLKSLVLLESLGFVHKGDGVALVHGCEPDPSRHFYSYYNESKEVDYIHLHTYVKGHPDIGGLINFRDKLLKDPLLRLEYERLKKNLYEKGKIRQEYTRSKEVFIQKVLRGKSTVKTCFQNFYYMRHGISESKIKNRIDHSHMDLSEEGINQVKSKKESIRKLTIKTVFSSPITRARETAKILFPDNSIEIIEEISECTKEIWDDIESCRESEAKKLYLEKVSRGIQKIQMKKIDQPFLLIAHGGTFWALSQILGFDFTLPKTADFIYLSCEQGIWKRKRLL